MACPVVTAVGVGTRHRRQCPVSEIPVGQGFKYRRGVPGGVPAHPLTGLRIPGCGHAPQWCRQLMEAVSRS